MKKRYPSVVIVGRMNVGKSTLFNRLSDSVKSITLDYAGVTRDIVTDTVTVDNKTFTLADTGGISLAGKSIDFITEKVRQKALEALAQADVVLFMVDGAAGVTYEDREIAQIVREYKKAQVPAILVINKSDTKKAQENEYEFSELGFNQQILISSEHGLNMPEFLDRLIEVLPAETATVDEKEAGCRVTLLGKPNVGKSSLMNALVQYERSIVSDIPGTTREAITEPVTFYQTTILVTDTPGVRKKKSVEEGLEGSMVKSAFNSLKDADLVMLVIDGSQPSIVDQELKLAFYAFTKQYKALLIVLNKQDLVTEESKKDFEHSLELYKHLVKKINIISVSCLTGKNMGKLIPLVHETCTRYTLKLDTYLLYTRFSQELTKRPLMHNKMALRVYEVRQLATGPITIGMEVNEPAWFGDSQKAFFEGIIREEYDLTGVPVKFIFR